MKIFLDNFKKKSSVGLIINWRFHKRNKWVSVFSPYFVNRFIEEFDPIIISSQLEYEIHKNKLNSILSMEPGWAAPKINYDKSLQQKKGFLLSDPHSKTTWLEKYVEKNDIDFVFSFYKSPFFYHFPNFPKEKFVHFPWAVPDEFIINDEVTYKNQQKVMAFGGKNSAAYDVRNWVRNQPRVESFDNSGVENKVLSDADFYKWLSGFDAIVAAGSSDPKYDLVTPKYFEIASSGALLIGQKCKDLETLGFNSDNMLVFDKTNFNSLVEEYLDDPIKYLEVRARGKALIQERHTISCRINKINSIYEL